MTQELMLGTSYGRKGGLPREFRVPVDIAGRRNAFIGTSGCGKTCAVAKLEEELLRVGQPFSVLDTVGVHLGLRAKKDGSPSGLPVVIFGGKRGDLPINHEEVGFGARLAELTLTSNIPIVIDLSKTPLSARFRIVGEYALTLMENESEDVRHIIVEETPEFIPQEIQHKGQDFCKAHMLRLVTLGRNNGYTVTLVGQRWATIDKTALAMIENFVIMRTIVKDDRKRLKEVFDEVAPDTDLSDCFGTMAKLEDGEAWFFSPQWLKRFERMKFNERNTFHPGETRKVGVKLQQVNMGDVQKFVSQLSKALSRTTVAAPAKKSFEPRPLLRRALAEVGEGTRTGRMKTSQPNYSSAVDALQEDNDKLKTKIATLNDEKAALSAQREWAVGQHGRALEFLKGKYEEAKEFIRFYEGLRGSDDPDAPVGGNGSTDHGKYADFLEAAGRYSAKKMLEVMMERKRVKKSQLMTLCRLRRSSFYQGRAWMVRNHLMHEDGADWVLSPL